MIFPDSLENGRVVVFRGCWNMAPLVTAFEKIGYEVWADRPDAELAKLKQGELVACITNIHSDIKQPWRTLQVKKQINRLGAPFIFWDRDGPSHMGEKAWRIWLLKNFEFMDVYATHTLQDAGRFAEEVIYLPNAAWIERYNLAGRSLDMLRDRSTYRYDVSFFGRIDPGKFPETEFRAAFFKKLRPVLDALGLRYYFGGHDVPVAAQIELIQTSVINLSCYAGCDVRYQGGYHGEPFSWGLPERCYGIPACGGFLLSDSRPHARDDFVVGEEWVEFASFDECVAKIRHHVDNFTSTRVIAEAAYRRVMSEHRYVDRAAKLLQSCLYWKQKKRLLPVSAGI